MSIASTSGPSRASAGSSDRRRGGPSCNTPRATRHYIGLDTLEVGFGIEWGDDYESIMGTLEAAKVAAADPESAIADRLVYFGEHRYEVSPSGAGGGAYMAYVLAGGGCRLLLMRRRSPHAQTPNVRIEVGAMGCLDAGGLVGLVSMIRDRVGSLGGRVVFDKPSRFDPMVDLAGVPVQQFVDLFRADQFVTRARCNAEYGEYRDGRRSTGFTIGRGIHLRVYDKVRELQRDPVKWAAWCQAEWGGDAPDSCTRVEFQLRRDAIKSFRINSLSDLLSRIGGVVRYLASQWFRFTDQRPDASNRHQSRCNTHPLWDRVVDAFGSAWCRVAGVVRRTIRQSASVDGLLRMVRGCVESIAALRGVRVDGVDDFVGYAVDLLYAGGVDLHDVPESVRRKRVLFESRCPVDSIVLAGVA